MQYSFGSLSRRNPGVEVYQRRNTTRVKIKKKLNKQQREKTGHNETEQELPAMLNDTWGGNGWNLASCPFHHLSTSNIKKLICFIQGKVIDQHCKISDGEQVVDQHKRRID